MLAGAAPRFYDAVPMRGRHSRNFFSRQPVVVRWQLAIFLWLVFLTIVSCNSSFLEQAPFDARTGAHVDDLSLVYPVWGACIEPLASLAQMIAGAPDMRKAVVAMFLWSILTPFLLTLLPAAWRFSTKRAFQISLTCGSAFLLYIAVVIVVPMPTWTLQDNRAGDVRADLHTHTLFSHDGLVSPSANLAHHQQVGDQVVVFSDHGLYPKNYHMNHVIIGSEQGVASGDFHVICIGLDPDKFTPVPLYGKEQLGELIRQVHEVHHGAVIAMTEHLKPEDVKDLVALGIDGFEIFNQGYTPPNQALRTALIDAEQQYGVALVADSDWHGWTTLNEQWTVFRTDRNGASPTQTVVSALRTHQAAAILPVTASHPGPVSFLHIALSPLTEAFRYATELSPLRLFAWWVWAGVLVLLIQYFSFRNIRCSSAIACSALTLAGTALLLASVKHFIDWWPFEGSNTFGRNLFILTTSLGLLCFSGLHLIVPRLRPKDNLLSNQPLTAQEG